MRDPVHRVKAHESPAVPRGPRNRTCFGACHGRLHHRPAAQNDERADGMEAETGNLPPASAQARSRSCALAGNARRRSGGNENRQQKELPDPWKYRATEAFSLMKLLKKAGIWKAR